MYCYPLKSWKKREERWHVFNEMSMTGRTNIGIDNLRCSYLCVEVAVSNVEILFFFYFYLTEGVEMASPFLKHLYDTFPHLSEVRLHFLLYLRCDSQM